MRAIVLFAGLVCLAVGGAADAHHGAIYEETEFAPIRPGGATVGIETVATGLTAPLKAVAAPGLPGQLFVVDQAGQVWAVDLATGSKAVFLDVSTRLVPLGVLGPDTFDERGLLGLAFHPGFATNGKLYTYTSEPTDPTAGRPTFPTTLPLGSAPDHQNVLAEWRAVDPGDPGRGVLPASRREIMRIDWPQFNHNGGDLAFGPDRMLYVSTGDGGGADDRDGQLFVVATGSFPVVEAPIVGHGLDGNAQKLGVPFGKILRIDVDGRSSANGQYGIPPDNPFVGMASGLGEIYAYGLRNPWRFSFDRATGQLYVGDVGQNDLEEVDVVVKGGNYGWPVKEGSVFFHHNFNDEGYATPDEPGTRPVPPGLIDPIAQYDTHTQGHSVIGGHVYRGSRIPDLQGRYVFAEFSTDFEFPLPAEPGRLLYLQQKKTSKGRLLNIQEFRIAGGAALGITLLGAGEDASGEVYFTGSATGLPFGTDGVLVRLAPVE